MYFQNIYFICNVVSKLGWSISKTLGVVAIFSCTFRITFRREAPFGSEIYVPNYPMSCIFRIYLVRMVYLQNPWSGCFSFFCTFRSTFRREAPFGNEIYLTKYPMSCSFRIYMVKMAYIQNPQSGFYFSAPSGAPSGGRCPLEMKYTYPSSLCHVVSEYIWLGLYSSKTHGLVACFFCTLKITFRRNAPLENEKHLP